MNYLDKHKKSIIINIMKKILVAFFILFGSTLSSFAMDYDSLYDAAEPFKTSLYHNVDPYEDEDNLKYTWSPYPLFRTSATLHFKDITVQPGYYLLTPRKLGDKEYILFKQNGKVVHIIPIAKKEATPINFYNANTPQVKQTKWQKFTTKVRKKFFDAAKDSGRSTPPNSLVDVNVEIKYIIMNFYYGEDKYIVLFKRSPY